VFEHFYISSKDEHFIYKVSKEFFNFYDFFFFVPHHSFVQELTFILILFLFFVNDREIIHFIIYYSILQCV
jgi:hypothetical protein